MKQKDGFLVCFIHSHISISYLDYLYILPYTDHHMHITILCAPGGSGHIQAAKALQTHAQIHPNTTVSYIDISSFFPTYINHLAFDSYNWSARYTPFIWGKIYKWTNNRLALSALKLIVWCVSNFYAKRTATLAQQIQQQNPQWVVCTHPVARLFVPKKSSAKVGVIITDYGLHSSWVSNPTDMFFIPTEHMIPDLVRYTVPKDHCVVSGIPVHPVFFQNKDTTILKQTYHINKEQKTILILTGGEGLIDPTHVIQTIFTLPDTLKLIVIGGNNPTLQDALTSLQPPAHISYSVIGWTQTMDEYMRIADYIITKPGGLSTSECLVLQKPMILISPIPGQEEKNCDVLCHMGAAVYAKKPIDIFKHLKKPLSIQKKSPNASQVILDTITDTIY